MHGPERHDDKSELPSFPAFTRPTSGESISNNRSQVLLRALGHPGIFSSKADQPFSRDCPFLEPVRRVMDLELARELQQAGFARKPKNRTELPFGDIGNYAEAVYVPSLSELLDACGDRQFFIGRFEEGGNFHVTYDGKKSECEGRTADEALARFWLAMTAK